MSICNQWNHSIWCWPVLPRLTYSFVKHWDLIFRTFTAIWFIIKVHFRRFSLHFPFNKSASELLHSESNFIVCFTVHTIICTLLFLIFCCIMKSSIIISSRLGYFSLVVSLFHHSFVNLCFCIQILFLKCINVTVLVLIFIVIKTHLSKSSSLLFAWPLFWLTSHSFLFIHIWALSCFLYFLSFVLVLNCKLWKWDIHIIVAWFGFENSILGIRSCNCLGTLL